MKVEQVFGAVALLALLLVGAFAMSGGRTGGATAATATVSAASTGLVLTGDAVADTCTCYEQAFQSARANADVQSLAYEAGYGACRDYAGAHGGAAWSWGYANGAEGKASKKSCRAYQAMLKG